MLKYSVNDKFRKIYSDDSGRAQYLVQSGRHFRTKQHLALRRLDFRKGFAGQQRDHGIPNPCVIGLQFLCNISIGLYFHAQLQTLTTIQM